MEGSVTIKTYRAKTAGDALAQVKNDLGREAVILHTRTYLAGGFLGLRRKRMTEITATTQQVARPVPRRGKAHTKRPSQATALDQSPVGSPPLSRMTPVAASATAVASSPAATLDTMTCDTPMKDVARMIVSASEGTPIEQEMASIKRMVGQVLRTTRGQGAAAMPEPLFKCYLKLMEAEVADEIADEIVGTVRDELETIELADDDIVQQAVLRRLATYIDVSADTSRLGPTDDGRPTTIALVGPTGVGKTTTLAKLAATYKLRHGRRVGMITSDTYRIAAVDQLRTYANIIGVELKVALTPREMTNACAALAANDVILIDTAGRAPRDAKRLTELDLFLKAADPHQTHLVLSGSGSEKSIEQAVTRFGTLAANGSSLRSSMKP